MYLEIEDKKCVKCHNSSLMVSIPESATRETITLFQNMFNYTLQGGLLGDCLRLASGKQIKIDECLEDLGDGTHIECSECEFMISFSRYYSLFH